MNEVQQLIYQIFGASLIIGLIKCAIQIAILALGIYFGMRMYKKHEARKEQKERDKTNPFA